MKHIKKCLALVLTLAMVMGMAVTAFAAGTGSITITPPEGVDDDVTITYSIYKVFDADASADGSKISYKLVDGKTTAPTGFTVDTAGNVKYDGGDDVTELTAADIAAIAAYVADDQPVATATSTGGANAVAKNLPNGYYYITTTTGTVVTINSTKPNATVDDKNVVPGIDKKITGASSFDEDGQKALAQVGTQVEYTVTITVGKGQTGYVMKDTLGPGLEYVADSLAVTNMTAGTDYTLTAEGQDITVTFEDDAIKDKAEGDEIVVTYKATVTSDALTVNAAKNTATISYGKDGMYTSEPVDVEVFNAKISVTKQDGAEQPLAGAGFILKNSENKYYTFADNAITWVNSEDDADVHTSSNDGAVPAFTGLADGTYTLIEKVVPAGYNKADDKDFTIAQGDYNAENLEQSATIVNQSGSVLPSTGGIGTTIFYVLGGILVVGAGVVLITRKRMGAQK